MALQVDISQSQFGIPFPSVYFRIVTASVSRTRDPNERYMVTMDIAGYATPPADDDTREIDFRRYHAPYSQVAAMPGDNVFAQCYAWAMMQPDMTGCLCV